MALPVNGLFGQALAPHGPGGRQTGSKRFFHFPSSKVRKWKNATICEASPRFHIGVRAVCTDIVLLKQSWKENTLPRHNGITGVMHSVVALGKLILALAKECKRSSYTSARWVRVHTCAHACVLGGVINKEAIFRDALFNNSGPISS